MGARGDPRHLGRGILTGLFALFGASVVALLVHVFVRSPRALARPTPTAPEPATAGAGTTVQPRRRTWAILRTLIFLVVCGALAGVPFALDAYADVEAVAVPIEVPSEDHEPLPPSYERAGLSEVASFDASAIVSDANAFRSSNRDLRVERLAREGRYALPVDRGLVTEADLESKHHDYPASDLAVPTGSAVYAAHAGSVETVTSRGRCGRGVVIAGEDGYGYIYCHGSEVLVEADQEVRTGDVLMLSGNTGRSTGPHLHFGIESAAGEKVCPQDLLVSWYEGGDASPDTAESSGCSYRTSKKNKKNQIGRSTMKPARGSRDGRGGDERQGPTPVPLPRPRPKLPTPTPIPGPEPTPDPTPDPTPVAPEEIQATATP